MLFFTKQRMVVAICMVTTFMAATTRSQAQTRPQRAARRTVLANAKNAVVTLNNAKTYYYLVSSEQTAMVRPDGEMVNIAGDEFKKTDIKSIRIVDLPHVLLDEDSTTYDKKLSVDHGLLALHRTLHPGKWNTLALPFSLTGRQVLDAFGEGTVVAQLKGVKEDDLTTILFESIDLNTDEAVMGVGLSYLIRPTREPDYSAEERITGFSTGRLYGPIYLIPNVSIKASQSPRTRTYSSSDGKTSVRIRGTFNKLDNTDVSGSYIRNKMIDPGTYMLDDNGLMTENTEATVVTAFTAWIENLGETKNLKFYINGAEEDITAIADAIQLPEALTNHWATGRVYDTQGRCIGHVSNGENIRTLQLPRGIYIVDGKKYVIQ